MKCSPILGCFDKQLDIEPKKDKNQLDYWIIRTKNPALIGFQLTSDYFAFSSDLKAQAKELLTDYPHKLVNRIIHLTLKEDKKVIEIDFKL